MKSILDKLPRYSTEDVSLPAPLYNKVKLGLLKLDKTLTFDIHGLRNLEVLLDSETWICRDVSLNNIPVLAWTEFNTTNRINLHEPVACKLYTYHAHAMLIIDTLLEQVDLELTRRLPHSDESAKIISIS